VIEPVLRQPDGPGLHTLVWKWPEPVRTLSSAPVGGGLNRTSWLLNIGVPLDYARIDLARHVSESVEALGISGEGIALFTAADVARVERASSEGVVVDTTVGIFKPTWAADPAGGYTPWKPGTINSVVQLPSVISVSAAVNAVITATEAKTQAIHEAGILGTGTASDAVVIVWPASPGAANDEVAQFAGPRSLWGSRMAQAVHASVAAGIDRWKK